MEERDDTNESRTLGQLFAAERERQGLARAEVAQRLHMSAWQIEALEAGDYGRLPKGTFLRGFVRNYAKALGLEPESMLAHLASSVPSNTAPGIVVPSQNIRFDPLGDRLANPYLKAGGIALGLAALALAAVYWWLFIRDTPPGGMAQKTSEPAPLNLAAPSMPPPEPPAAPQSAPMEMPKDEAPEVIEPPKAAGPKNVAQTRPAPPPRLEPPVVTPVADAAAVSSGNARRMKLRFKGESWVEIRDGKGKVLLSRLNSPGSEAEVTGRPPLNVIIGNAPEVQVTYEDRAFPLEPHTRVAVARFTVE
ncbi:MAG: helix-turn-helix domain-containing protein [Usitatibacter sp.]